jgi:fatty-acyl-CoA synthase
VSWLPLYHDMGLVGFLALPMTTGTDLVQAAPQDFLAHPGHWMEWISAYRGTATAGPNFSWVLTTRALKRMRDLDLSSLRLALNGAEPVDPDAVEAFVQAAAPFGFRADAVFPAFGMAEVAIGGAFPPPGRGLVFDVVDANALEHEHVAKPVDTEPPHSRKLALLGQPVPGLRFRIIDTNTHAVLPERHVGELQIAGTSLTPGYYKRPEATAELFDGEWLKTGDLAYLVDGELVICGRIKDVIIVGGRNVYPQDVERAIGGLDGVRAGNVIAFGVGGYKGKETVVVVAETRTDDPTALRKAIHHRVLDAVGLPARDVMLVQPGTLPKTSSGKLQRALCKDRYLNEELQLISES